MERRRGKAIIKETDRIFQYIQVFPSDAGKEDKGKKNCMAEEEHERDGKGRCLMLVLLSSSHGKGRENGMAETEQEVA